MSLHFRMDISESKTHNNRPNHCMNLVAHLQNEDLKLILFSCCPSCYCYILHISFGAAFPSAILRVLVFTTYTLAKKHTAVYKFLRDTYSNDCSRAS